MFSVLQDEDYERATALAFEMRHPGRLLAVVRQALERGQAEGARLLGSLAAAMGPEDLRQCLEYCRQATSGSKHRMWPAASVPALLLVIDWDGGVPKPWGCLRPGCHVCSHTLLPAGIPWRACREWNANAKNCQAAQAMLRAVLRQRRPQVGGNKRSRGCCNCNCLPGCQDPAHAS